ncbi:MAG: ATP-binding protein [Bacteroidales bacterium]|nr:ATP-binding protein [Bacteroidales bacterium]MBQ6726600.1 ATP-binding protein [Bacteroidales bacterium]
MHFKRKIYDEMLRWKREKGGKTALLIKGARRVGKTTIVKEFAQREYDSYIFIDFSNVSKNISSLFDDMSDLNYFFLHLQTETGVVLHKRRSVIVFDEVQLKPLARQSIKHLVADGRYDYIETGSLLTLKKNVKDIVIPSEETRLTMHPLDFEEFLWATGNETGLDFIRLFLDMKKPLEQSHRKIMRNLRLYLLVGGMPQSVDTYLSNNNFQDVDETKRGIISLYDDDFRKIDTSGKASRLFFNIPGQLNHNAARYHIGSVVGQNNENTQTVIADMADSLVVSLAYHANDPNVGMGLSKDINLYKMFLCDTGLFVTMAFWDKSQTENVIYQQLLSDKLPANLGYVYENLAAQMLLAAGNQLYYYTFPDGNKHNYEIDFIISRGNKLCPIEVKSSGYRTHKSLDLFCEKYSSRIGNRYLLYTKDFQRDGQTLCVPFYMAGLI